MERRYKRVLVNTNRLISLFTIPRFMEENSSYYFKVNYLEGLPEDFEVRHVTFNDTHAAWCLIIWSSEFDIIPESHEVPLLDWKEDIKTKTVKYSKADNNQIPSAIVRYGEKGESPRNFVVFDNLEKAQDFADEKEDAGYEVRLHTVKSWSY